MTTSNLDAMEMLKRLKELLDIGAITQEEFDSKKAELIGQINFTAQHKALPRPNETPEVVDVEFKSVDDIDPKYAKSFSEDSFWSKIASVLKSAGLEIIYKALQLYYAMQNPNCPMSVKAGIIAALGYFISPIDLIPDFIPVVGFTDDLTAIGAAIAMAHMYIDGNVKRMAREKIDDIFGAGTSEGLD